MTKKLCKEVNREVKEKAGKLEKSRETTRRRRSSKIIIKAGKLEKKQGNYNRSRKIRKEAGKLEKKKGD